MASLQSQRAPSQLHTSTSESEGSCNSCNAIKWRQTSLLCPTVWLVSYSQGMSSFATAPPRLDSPNLMSVVAVAAAAVSPPQGGSPARTHSPPPRLGSPGLVQVRDCHCRTISAKNFDTKCTLGKVQHLLRMCRVGARPASACRGACPAHKQLMCDAKCMPSSLSRL